MANCFGICSAVGTFPITSGFIQALSGSTSFLGAARMADVPLLLAVVYPLSQTTRTLAFAELGLQKVLAMFRMDRKRPIYFAAYFNPQIRPGGVIFLNLLFSRCINRAPGMLSCQP